MPLLVTQRHGIPFSELRLITMSAPPKFLELPGLCVTLDRLVYRDVAEESPDRPHSFAYFLTIECNDTFCWYRLGQIALFTAAETAQ